MKDRTIASVAASYDLVAQTVGNWVARYRKERATDQDRRKASESAEIAELKEEVRELRQENEFLKKAAARLAERHRGRGRKEGRYPVSSMCRWSGGARGPGTTPGATDPSPCPPSEGESWP